MYRAKVCVRSSVPAERVPPRPTACLLSQAPRAGGLVVRQTRVREGQQRPRHQLRGRTLMPNFNREAQFRTRFTDIGRAHAFWVRANPGRADQGWPVPKTPVLGQTRENMSKMTVGGLKSAKLKTWPRFVLDTFYQHWPSTCVLGTGQPGPG